MVPVYVIHAAFLHDRARAVEAELERHGLRFEWVSDFDPPDLTASIETLFFSPDAELTPAQRSCAMKHVVAHQRIAEAGHPAALVLEDDAILACDFRASLGAVLREAEGCEPSFVLSLGTASNRFVPSRQLRPGRLLYPAERHRNAEAYVLGAREAALRLGWIAAHKLDRPVDLAFDHMDPQLGIRILWSEPPLAEQGSITGRYTSTVSPKSRSRLHIWVRYRYDRLRRRYIQRWLGRD